MMKNPRRSSREDEGCNADSDKDYGMEVAGRYET